MPLTYQTLSGIPLPTVCDSCLKDSSYLSTQPYRGSEMRSVGGPKGRDAISGRLRIGRLRMPMGRGCVFDHFT